MMLQQFSAKRWAAGVLSLASALMLAAVGGCHNQDQNQGGPAAQNQTQTPGDDPKIIKTVIRTAPEHDKSPLNNFDPCAARIEDLIGPFLSYYKINHRYPATLDELNRYAVDGVPFEATCPVSKLPYLYAPNGLSAPGENIRVYIYDATPVHSGERWCVVNDGAISGAQGFSTVHIPEPRFQKFLASAAPATQASPAPLR